MAGKEKEHCGIRNGKFWCYHCGGSQSQQFPIAVDMYIDNMQAFAKLHKDCEPVWKEPVPDMNATKLERIKWWAEFGEHGISAKTIYTVMLMGENPSSELFTGLFGLDVFILPKEYGHPHDPDDFNRCYKLIKAIPEWEDDLDKLRFISPVWSKIVTHWDTLCTMLEEPAHNGEEMYDFMKSLGC